MVNSIGSHIASFICGKQAFKFILLQILLYFVYFPPSYSLCNPYIILVEALALADYCSPGALFHAWFEALAHVVLCSLIL